MQPNNTVPENNSGNVRHSRLKLVAIFSLFIGPLLVAFIWYYGFDAKFAPTSQVNHAPLISPVVTIGDFDNPLYGGGSVSRDAFTRKWTLVHIIGESCDEHCEIFLYHTRQTRIALGKDSGRLQRFVIIADQGLAEKLKSGHPDAFLVEAHAGLEAELETMISHRPPGDAILIDPLGNAMMRIPADLDPRLLLKDLKKLLKLSHIG